jgi:hypothetical protein
MLIQYMASVVVFELHRTCSHSLSGCIRHGFPLVLGGLGVVASKVEVVMSIPRPKDISRLRAFLGLCNTIGSL